MLQKKKLTTPTTRFASINYIKDFKKNTLKQYYKKKNKINFHRKTFYNINKNSLTRVKNLSPGGVITEFLYNKKPFQLFIMMKTLFNKQILLPGIENLLPGKKVFNLTLDIIIKKTFYIGSQAYLQDLPYYTFISSLSNNTSKKLTFVRSSGTYGVKLKGKKTVKLILVKLPSGKIYLFFKRTECFIGKNYNFFNNKFIEGK